MIIISLMRVIPLRHGCLHSIPMPAWHRRTDAGSSLVGDGYRITPVAAAPGLMLIVLKDVVLIQLH
jgi:hypothetical protein